MTPGRAALLIALALATSAPAQTESEAAPEAVSDAVEAPGAVLRLLDRMTGMVEDATLAKGQARALGRLSVVMDACRYPQDLPLAEAFAHLTITDPETPEPLFRGWMIASSPALSALDHPRYDVWVLHCDVPASTSDGEGEGG
jgi:hypothetical protein